MAGKGMPKSGGRKPGTPNKRTQTLREKADELGVDPFTILLLVAKGDWAALGYEAGSTTRWTNAGIEYEEERISIQDRIRAAGEASQYLEPKRRAVEHTLSPEDQAALATLKELKGKDERELVALYEKELAAQKKALQ